LGERKKQTLKGPQNGKTLANKFEKSACLASPHKFIPQKVSHYYPQTRNTGIPTIMEADVTRV
jgi:hypothetical protein